MSRVSVAPQTVRVFLTYSGADTKTAGEVASLLRSTVPEIELWTPELFWKPGTDVGEAVREALRNCHAFMVLFSTASVNSPNLVSELGAAWALKKRIIAVTTHDKVLLPFLPPSVRSVTLGELRKSPRRLGAWLRKAAAS